MQFIRPKRAHSPPPWRSPSATAPAQPGPDAEPPPNQANPGGTIIALFGLAFTALMLAGSEPSTMARVAAIGTAISIAASVLADLRQGARNVIRADVMAIAAFYFLTLFEFLFPQERFDTLIGLRATKNAIFTVLIGFAGLLIGRHLLHPKRHPFPDVFRREIPAGWLVTICVMSFVIGFAHMFIAVNFNVFELVDWMMAPRFSQPWGRGKFGDWKALLIELGMFMYLIPPIAGIAFARRHRFSSAQLTVLFCLLAFTVFHGFMSGTRNLFVAFLITFIIGYAFASQSARRKELFIVSGLGAVLLLVSTVVMLQFRNIGFSNWVNGTYDRPRHSIEETMFVDYNLYAIAKLTEVFPSRNPYLGWEVPYLALIRPIPRALWKGKPEGLSSSIEDALGVEGLTIAASFAGEAYMGGGWIAVFICGLFFGGITGWWSFLASPKNSELGILIYASGFFAAVISMRSLFVFTTALLPTLAALVIGTFAVRKLAAQAQRWLLRPKPRPMPQKRIPPPPRPR